MSDCRFSRLEAGVDGNGVVRHRSAVLYDKPCESQMCGGEYVQRLRRYYTATTGPVVVMDRHGVPRDRPLPSGGEPTPDLSKNWTDYSFEHLAEDAPTSPPAEPTR